VNTVRDIVVGLSHSLASLTVQKWLMVDVPFCLKFCPKLTHPISYKYSFVEP